jgi:hypothetical protein
MLDLLDGLDDLIGGEPPSDLGGGSITEDEGEGMSDPVEEEGSTDDGYSQDEEWAGISKGGQEQEGESGLSDNKSPRLVPLVDPSPARTMSRSWTFYPALVSETLHRCREIYPASPSTNKK